MKRLIALLLLGCALAHGAAAQTLPLLGAGAGSSGTADAPQTTAFLARANAVTTLDATHTNAYKALINGGVADGWFQKMDLLFICATQSQGVALLNLPSATYTATNVNALFVVDIGFNGNGQIDGRVDTDFNPTTAVAPNYTQNSAHISAWSLTTVVPSIAPSIKMGAGAGASQLYVRFADDNVYARVTDAVPSGGFPNTLTTGLFVGNRSSSTAREIYRNAVSVGSYAATASATPESAIFAFVNEAGGAGVAADNIVAAASAGGDLTPTDVTNFYNRMRTYMTAVGVP